MARIDDSHHSFKRGVKLGPGPKKQTLEREGDWECQKGKNTKTHYVQTCTYVGDNRARRGKKIKVARSKAKKKAYNKLFRAFQKKNARLAKLQKKGRRPGYRCRKTPAAKCVK
jgi:hypothetical protein